MTKKSGLEAAGEAVLNGKAKPSIKIGNGAGRMPNLEDLKTQARTNKRISVTLVSATGERIPIAFDEEKAAQLVPPAAVPAETPEPKLTPLRPEAETAPATVVVRPSPRIAKMARTVDPSAFLAAMNLDVARGIVEGFMTFATRAAVEQSRACYRCKHTVDKGYIFGEQLVCRDCREGHRQDYYAGQGKTAPVRTPRGRRNETRVTELHVTAERCTVVAPTS